MLHSLTLIKVKAGEIPLLYYFYFVVLIFGRLFAWFEL